MDRCLFQLFIFRAVQPLGEGSATNFLRCWWIQGWQHALTNVAPGVLKRTGLNRLLKRAQDKQIWRPALFCSHWHRPLPGYRNLVLPRNFFRAKKIRYVKQRARPATLFYPSKSSSWLHYEIDNFLHCQTSESPRNSPRQTACSIQLDLAIIT